jgi:hypothetical protein
MRSITTVAFRGDSGARAAAVVRHLQGDDEWLDGGELTSMFDALPAEVRARQAGHIPGPEHDAIKRVVSERGYVPGELLFAQASDALSLMCQTVPAELLRDRIEGTVTVGAGLGAVNGIISRGANRGELQIRLRGATSVLYQATEQLIRDIARADDQLLVGDMSAVIKERDAHHVFERADLDLIRSRGAVAMLWSATRQRAVDPALSVFVLVLVLGGALSWLMHFHPQVLGMSHWRAEDVVWVDGWIGRLVSAAMFGLLTTLAILVSTMRRAMAENDGVYMTFVWKRAGA